MYLSIAKNISIPYYFFTDFRHVTRFKHQLEYEKEAVPILPVIHDQELTWAKAKISIGSIIAFLNTMLCICFHISPIIVIHIQSQALFPTLFKD